MEDQSRLVREGREVVRGALVAWIRGAWPRLPEEMVQVRRRCKCNIYLKVLM